MTRLHGEKGTLGRKSAQTGTDRETGDTGVIQLVRLGGRGPHVVMVVSGFLSEGSPPDGDWKGLKTLFPFSERVALDWSAGRLALLGQLLSQTIGADVVPQTKVARVLRPVADLFLNWKAATSEAERAGKLLANRLSAPEFLDGRPVSLVGFSLGARVIAEAAVRMDPRAIRSRLRELYLLGGAVPRDHGIFRKLRAMTPGVVANAYSRTDWILRYLYQGAEWHAPIGIGPVRARSVVNVDVTDIADGHLAYRSNIDEVLAAVCHAVAQKGRRRRTGRDPSQRRA